MQKSDVEELSSLIIGQNFLLRNFVEFGNSKKDSPRQIPFNFPLKSPLLSNSYLKRVVDWRVPISVNNTVLTKNSIAKFFNQELWTGLLLVAWPGKFGQVNTQS